VRVHTPSHTQHPAASVARCSATCFLPSPVGWVSASADRCDTRVHENMTAGSHCIALSRPRGRLQAPLPILGIASASGHPRPIHSMEGMDCPLHVRVPVSASAESQRSPQRLISHALRPREALRDDCTRGARTALPHSYTPLAV